MIHIYKTENFIEEIQVVSYLKKYNWKVIDKIQYSDKPNNLSNQYVWWIVERIDL
jgi:hypothetical protein